MIPRSLGLSAPEGSDVYEFLFTVKSRPEYLARYLIYLVRTMST